MRRAVILAALILVAAPALAETRCGWIDNPTPGNWFLTDRDGAWALGLQGVDLGNNWLDVDVPEFAEWASDGGRAGFGCGCFEGTVDRRSGDASWISSVRALPLSRCHDDPALPAR